MNGLYVYGLKMLLLSLIFLPVNSCSARLSAQPDTTHIQSGLKNDFLTP